MLTYVWNTNRPSMCISVNGDPCDICGEDPPAIPELTLTDEEEGDTT